MCYSPLLFSSRLTILSSSLGSLDFWMRSMCGGIMVCWREGGFEGLGGIFVSSADIPGPFLLCYWDDVDTFLLTTFYDPICFPHQGASNSALKGIMLIVVLSSRNSGDRFAQHKDVVPLYLSMRSWKLRMFVERCEPRYGGCGASRVQQCACLPRKFLYPGLERAPPVSDITRTALS